MKARVAVLFVLAACGPAVVAPNVPTVEGDAGASTTPASSAAASAAPSASASVGSSTGVGVGSSAGVGVGASPSGSASPSASAGVRVGVSASGGTGIGDLGFAPKLLARLAKEADAQPAGKLVVKPPPDAERDAAIHSLFGARCRLERTCGPLWGIDCDAAVDGPYEYVRVRADRVERITTCGGACMGGRCTNCPPRAQGWTCPTY